MGNISSVGTMLPISFGSTIIGFVSFAFTIATFLRVFWSELSTLSDATHEIKDVLGNLKQSLYEERNHLRVVRRRCKGEYEAGAFKVLADAVKQMIKDFKKMEAPFLEQHPMPLDIHHRRKSNSSRRRSREYGISGSGGESGKHWEEKGEKDEEGRDDYFNTTYKTKGIGHRLLWLRKRGKAITLTEQLAWVQTRRIARQTTDIAAATTWLVRAVQDLDEKVDGLEMMLWRSNGARRGN